MDSSKTFDDLGSDTEVSWSQCCMFTRGTLSVIVAADDNAAIVVFGALRKFGIDPFPEEKN